MRIFQIAAVFLVVLGLAISTTLFTVDEREFAIKLHLGKVEKADYQPGLHFKLPLVNEVRKFDQRLQTVDLQPEQFLTSEQKYMIVDSFVKWRIADVVNFFTATRGNYITANSRLGDLINNSLKASISDHTIQEAISDKRLAIMQAVEQAVNKQANTLGIEVTDVRIKRLDFPKDVRTKVFERMQKDREKVARELRSTGQEQAKAIRADADRQHQELLAEAYREAENIRGEGDAKAAETYAAAYGRDREFYRFYRSLNAYKNSFSEKRDILIVEPDSDFFRYFDSISGE